MLQAPNFILKNAFNPKDMNGITQTGVSLDTSLMGGFRAATIIVNIGNIAADVTTLKVQESADDSSYADITGASFTAPTGAGSDNTAVAMTIALGGVRKRYLRATITGGAGATLIGGSWIGEGCVQFPNSATERGLAEYVFISNGA